MLELNKIYNWDCLEEMDKLIEQWIKVDAIITDPPYWTTACKRDSVIPFDKMWERLNKLIKPNWAIVLFWSEPFSSALRMSNIKMYKYDLVWKKQKPVNFLQLKRRFWKTTENICIFYNKQCTYNPQKYKIEDSKKVKNKVQKWKWNSITSAIWFKARAYIDDWTRYPTDILEFNRVPESKILHPTQKPVALIEYLIKTYTNEWELVLDFTAGSFTTCVAADNTNRKWIWIEMSEEYCKIWKERIIKNRIEKWLDLLDFTSNI